MRSVSTLLYVLCAAGLVGCGEDVMPDRDLSYWADAQGDPIGGLSGVTLERYNRGREVMSRAFLPNTGLGPAFNGDSCASCHQFPEGGSAPRYRDLFLVRAPRDDGALVDVGTNGLSPVRNLYHLDEGHIAEPSHTTVYARRNAPSGLGIGLFEFVSEKEILKREDPDDKNGDGISGRANYEQGEVGRFGYKAQASGLESFNRGAFFNQMGVTTDPIHVTFPESWDLNEQTALLDLVFEGLIPTAHAQVSAPNEPTVDDDGVPDPELSNEDQTDLLFFSTYLAPMRPAEPNDAMKRGAKAFKDANCTSCHTPSLKSTIGPLFAYTDLLLHDMGPDYDNDIEVSYARPSEFRTAPLWGVALHGPFLHDGRAETLEEAILMHGGEAQASRDAFAARSAQDQQDIVDFLRGLGGWTPDGQIFMTPDTPTYREGEEGGPIVGLTAEERAQWDRGQMIFDQTADLAEGLGSTFNADACRACHQDPVLGGAGGIDTNVIRYGEWDAQGEFHSFEQPIVPRQSLPGEFPYRMNDSANVVEWRNPISVLGSGLLDQIPEDAILVNADPDDLDGDGISGRARILDTGELGRLGWKAQIPTVFDFVADALLNETGQTVEASFSAFTAADDGDAFADPELPDDTFLDLAFYLQQLAPPTPRPAEDAAQAEQGRVLFTDIGCASCHTPELNGVPAYSDLLLHDVADPDGAYVSQDPGVLPTEFRTPPLWGVVGTAPYLHDGRASTLTDAIDGHFGEAATSKSAFSDLSETERAALVAFLKSI